MKSYNTLNAQDALNRLLELAHQLDPKITEHDINGVRFSAHIGNATIRFEMGVDKATITIGKQSNVDEAHITENFMGHGFEQHAYTALRQMIFAALVGSDNRVNGVTK